LDICEGCVIDSQDNSLPAETIDLYYDSTSDVVETIPVYRFWSSRYRSHFYTSDQSERNKVISQYGSDWDYEGISFQVLSKDTCDTGIPIYRFWSDRYRSHFYTKEESEKNKLID